jgi:hypothetical protein
MSEGKDSWVDEIKYERKNLSFEVDMETFGKIKQFSSKYNIDQINQAIDCLINVGLTLDGFRTQQEINAKFKDIGFSYDTPNALTENDVSDQTEQQTPFANGNVYQIAKQEKSTIENPFKNNTTEKTFEIIKKICSFSDDGNAIHYDILMEAESNGLESEKVEEAIDQLKQQGHIQESSHKRYKIMGVNKLDGNFFEF